MRKYTDVYKGEEPPKRKDVLWAHHSIKDDLTSPVVVQIFSKGKWVDAYEGGGAEVERLSEELGDITNLKTTDKDSTVDAINEVVDNVGDLSGLTTTAKTDLVSAINEASTKGDPASLLYTAQSLTEAQKTQALANIGAASQQEFESLSAGEVVPVTELPNASDDTMGKIYLVGPDANDEYDRYISSYNGTNYSWVQVGTTQMDLSGYATDAEVSQLEAEVNDLVEDTEHDFAIADTNGNNLVVFDNGHIKTKKFDSSNTPTNDDIIQIESEEDGDLSFSDEDENVLMLLYNGHIKTKNFDSSKLPILAIKKAVFMGDSITQGVYSYWHNDTHTDANRYNGFDLQSMTDIAEETAYHGIHYYFGLLSGANVVNLGRRGSGWVIDTRNIGNALEMANDYDFSRVDFVALCFGVNDYIMGATIGDISTQAANTVIGNMCRTIEKILTDNPLCKVVVYTPYNTWGQVSYGGDYTSNVLYGDESTNYALGYTRHGNTLQDIINAMQTVCNFYGIQCVDLSRSNVCNRFTIKNIMVDGLHPTKESYVKLAAEIYGKGNFGA